MTQDRQPPGPSGEVTAFLSQPETFGGTPVERIETHAALVFLSGDRAIKIKKPVALGYLDFSTADKRRRALARELELNQPNAPEIYLDLVPVVRAAGGKLALGGDGEPVEWALVMRRFDQDRLLDRIAAQGPLDADLATALADAVLAAHRKAPVADIDQVAAMTRLVGQLSDDLERLVTRLVTGLGQPAAFRAAAGQALERACGSLAARGSGGFVRRCHGDLHLGNIVVIDGRPVLFDALEFDEQLATIDVLYDLAFLLMDLDRRNQRPAGARVLNRYLQGAPGNEAGLAALPLFLGLRAGVRAMVIAERSRQSGEDDPRIGEYLGAALDAFSPPPPRLVAVGGFSGTGKTTLAAALAAGIGASPGALHLRSDVERKSLFGVSETTRLAPEHYEPAVTARVYRRIEDRARAALQAGHSVVADAVFARADERQALEDIARQAGAAFTGIWLSAPRDRLAERVAARRGDASDATAAVVEMQMERGAGTVTWETLDASAGPDRVAATARTLLGL
jgi:uncharacterized protein